MPKLDKLTPISALKIPGIPQKVQIEAEKFDYNNNKHILLKDNRHLERDPDVVIKFKDEALFM